MGDKSNVSDSRLENLGGFRENKVAFCVTICPVDFFEVVQVQHDAGNLVFANPRIFAEQKFQIVAVKKSGQVVAEYLFGLKACEDSGHRNRKGRGDNGNAIAERLDKRTDQGRYKIGPHGECLKNSALHPGLSVENKRIDQNAVIHGEIVPVPGLTSVNVIGIDGKNNRLYKVGAHQEDASPDKDEKDSLVHLRKFSVQMDRKKAHPAKPGQHNGRVQPGVGRVNDESGDRTRLSVEIVRNRVRNAVRKRQEHEHHQGYVFWGFVPKTPQVPSDEDYNQDNSKNVRNKDGQ